MEKNEWLKAISLDKAELIKWLNEEYEEERNLRDIIRRYEKDYASVSDEMAEIPNLETGLIEQKFYWKVDTKNFSYKRTWV